MRRLSIGLMVCVGGWAIAGCPPSTRTDAGVGIDANLGTTDANVPRNDAFVAACATMGPEDTATACADGCNNDGDGFADCDDFDCCDVVTCGPATGCGRRTMNDAGVRADAFVPACATTGPEDTATACADGCNNDGDAFADCNDFDCCDVVTCGADTGCGRRAMRDAGPRADAAVMACAVTGPENTAGACGDACDNDGDGFFDCGDFDCCRVISGCGPTTACGRDAGTSTRDAGPSTRCDAGAGAAAEMGMAACTDGIDNDCDGFTDCRDFGCNRDAPTPRDYCVTTPENTLAACSDTMDNDLNGFIDCNDRNCCGIRTVASCEAGSYIARGSCP
jgi:hypothetical protein